MDTKQCDYLLMDISNLLHRTFFAQTGEDDETLAGLACHMALTTLNKYYKQYKPRKKVVMLFDRSSWRKEYTNEHDFLKPYKGNRRQDMTPAQKLKYERFCNHLKEFEALITKHTTIVTLFGDRLEADDLIAGFVQREREDNIVIITADSDMAQLLKYNNVEVISPITDKPQATLEKYDNDAEYYLFFKCIRGDASDNVASAFPRVRATKIKEVYDNALDGDGYKYVNFMNEQWTDQNKRKFTVGEMFKHNQILIDLECQPDDIKKIISEVITTELDLKKHFSYFHILKFIGKYKLKKLADTIDNFVPMLSR
ncbi:hypothetical protein M0R04_06830 [Candidatus Dojkabacteria bacterium]|jgi:hypothetical protein|nr:hypothetical protein [Candidatus Dojkabacteria bacterium]